MKIATLGTPQTLKGNCTQCSSDAYRTHESGPVSHSDSGEGECELVTENVTVTLTVTISRADLDAEFDGTPSELADAICGRLNEIDTNTGGVVVPAALVLS